MSRNLVWAAAISLVAACTVSTAPGSQPRSTYVAEPPPPAPRDHRGPPPPPPSAEPGRRPRPLPDFAAQGWMLLGEKTVDGRVDSDQVDFSQKRGKVSRIQVVVLDSDLEMTDLRVVFVSGNDFRPTDRHYFREGSRTRPIELPATEILRAVQFQYRNLPGGGRARVQVWAK